MKLIEKTTHRLRLTFRQMETFIAVARCDSTHQAASELARSQSAISTALLELESVLGVPLFERIGRRLRLNEHGRQLLPQATGMLERAAEFEVGFRHEALPPLRLSASYTAGEYLLPPLIASWKHQHPQAAVRLAIANTESVLDALLAFEIDLGFIEGANTCAELLTEHWLHDELAVFAAPSHPLARRRVEPEELTNALWLMRELGSGTREAADRLLESLPGRPRVQIELGSNEALKNAVATGAGLGCLSVHAVVDAFKRGWLVPLDVDLPAGRRSLSIVTHRNKQPRQLARDFADHCRRHVQPFDCDRISENAEGSFSRHVVNPTIRQASASD